MVRVNLPREIELLCPTCRSKFRLATRTLTQRQTVHCPFCTAEFNMYDALDGLLRRQLYHAIRNAIEHRVYEQKRMEQPDYFEDRANLEDN
jgi:hypothetical protein